MRVPRVRTAFRTLSIRTSDRLDCAANAKICIFATSGGIHAHTEPGELEKAWLRYVAATHKCSAGTEISSL